MSVQSIKPSFTQFQDIDGQPLENGNVYIGTAGLDAKTNQIQVYWDKAKTLPASQPISTLNGYLSNAGTPGTIYVDANDYSILVENKNNSTVTSSLNLNESLSANTINFALSSAGAVSRTVQSKLTDFISVKDFGAVGDGVTDDTASIQAAIDAAFKKPNYSDYNEVNEVYRENGSYSNIVIFPEGTYVVSDTILLKNCVRIVGEGSANTKILPASSFSSSKTRTLYLPGGNESISFIFDSRQDVASQWSWAIDIIGIGIANTNGVANLGGINLTNTHKWLIENCSFSNMSYGIYLYGSWLGTARRNTTHSCNIVGIYLNFIDGSVDTAIGSDQECNGIILEDNYIQYGNKQGYRFDRCNGVIIQGGAIERCGTDALYSDGNNKGIQINSYFEGNCRILDSSDSLYDPGASISDYYDINMGNNTDYMVTINSIFYEAHNRLISIGTGKNFHIKAFNFLNTVNAKAIVEMKSADVKDINIESVAYDPNTTPTESIILNNSGDKYVFATPLKMSFFTYGNDNVIVSHINTANPSALILDKDLICNNGDLSIQTTIVGNGNKLTAQLQNTQVLTVSGNFVLFENVLFGSESSTTTGGMVEIQGDFCKFDKCRFSGVSTTGALRITSGSNTSVEGCLFELASSNRLATIQTQNNNFFNCASTSSSIIRIEDINNYFNVIDPDVSFDDTTSSKVNFYDTRMYRTTTPIHTPASDVDRIAYNSSPTPGGTIGWVYASGAWKSWGNISL